MYLSRLVLNARERDVRRDLANPYEMHRTLSRGFPAPSDNRPFRFLWRLEPARRGQAPVVLVQSEATPQWGLIAARYPEYLAEFGVKDYRLPERLRAGQVLRFRLRANPTVTREGKRHGLRGDNKEVEWLYRQGGKYGFAVLGCILSHPHLLRAWRNVGSGNGITVQAVTYDGSLRVDDPVRMRDAITSGLGHAKAMGLGLLSIAPVG